MTYEIGTQLQWRDAGLRDKYGVRIHSYRKDTNQYVIEWTALEDGVENKELGYKWTTSWGGEAIERRLSIIKKPCRLPEDLFTL